MPASGHHMPVWYDEDSGPSDGQTVTWVDARKRFEPVTPGDGGSDQTIDGGTP
jgi:hypothetical protein